MLLDVTEIVTVYCEMSERGKNQMAKEHIRYGWMVFPEREIGEAGKSYPGIGRGLSVGGKLTEETYVLDGAPPAFRYLTGR